MTPQERAAALEANQEFQSVHKQKAAEGGSALPGEQSEVSWEEPPGGEGGGGKGESCRRAVGRRKQRGRHDGEFKVRVQMRGERWVGVAQGTGKA